MAAPPAISGVFAFEASSATLPPALPIAPFELPARDVVRARDVAPAPVRDLDGLDELLRARVLPAREFVLFVLVDELFRPVDRADFEPVRRERVLVDRVV
jgi:hypothetical protein